MKMRGKVWAWGHHPLFPRGGRRSRSPAIQLASASARRAPVAATGASAVSPSTATDLFWLCATVCIPFLSLFYQTLSLISLSPMTTRSSWYHNHILHFWSQ